MHFSLSLRQLHIALLMTWPSEGHSMAGCSMTTLDALQSPTFTPSSKRHSPGHTRLGVSLASEASQPQPLSQTRKRPQARVWGSFFGHLARTEASSGFSLHPLTSCLPVISHCTTTLPSRRPHSRRRRAMRASGQRAGTSAAAKKLKQRTSTSGSHSVDRTRT